MSVWGTWLKACRDRQIFSPATPVGCTQCFGGERHNAANAGPQLETEAASSRKFCTVSSNERRQREGIVQRKVDGQSQTHRADERRTRREAGWPNARVSHAKYTGARRTTGRRAPEKKLSTELFYGFRLKTRIHATRAKEASKRETERHEDRNLGNYINTSGTAEASGKMLKELRTTTK